MKIEGCTALVTGANRGIGEGFVEVLLQRGARRVYATARDPDKLAPLVARDSARVVPLALDIGDADQRAQAFATATDLSLLINNAGIPGDLDRPMERRLIAAESLADARRVFEIDFFATVEMCRGFAPILKANGGQVGGGGGGGIINIISIGALFALPEYGSYCCAKSALGIATQAIRAELYPQGTRVTGVYTAGVRTRMSRMPHEVRISSPAEHAEEVLSGFEAGQEEIYAGTGGLDMQKRIHADPKGFEAEVRERFLNNPIP